MKKRSLATCCGLAATLVVALSPSTAAAAHGPCVFTGEKQFSYGDVYLFPAKWRISGKLTSCQGMGADHTKGTLSVPSATILPLNPRLPAPFENCAYSGGGSGTIVWNNGRTSSFTFTYRDNYGTESWSAKLGAGRFGAYKRFDSAITHAPTPCGVTWCVWALGHICRYVGTGKAVKFQGILNLHN